MTPTGRETPRRATVVIVHYDGLELLRRCLDSILASDASDAEILVVDNASRDRCTEALSAQYASVRFVRSPENLGSSGGWNLGARQASGQVLVFLNDDVVVTREWLGPLLARLEDRAVGCASGMALFLDAPRRVNSAGGICDALGFGQNRGIGADAASFGDDGHPPVFYAVGTAFAARRDVFDATGGFDAAAFMYADDLDWSWRLRLAGYEIAVEPKCLVYHKWHGSAMDFPRMAYYLERNQLRTVLKNYRAGTLVWIAPVLVAVKTMRALWLGLRDRTLLASTARAWIWNAEVLRDTRRVRREVQSRRRVGDRSILAHMVPGSL